VLPKLSTRLNEIVAALTRGESGSSGAALARRGYMIKRKSLDARLRPTASQWEALELARKTGTLRRRNGGLWVPTDTPDGLPDYPRPYNFPLVTTATVRACIGRGWLESTGRDFVTITLIGKRVLTHRRHTVSTAI
jgi:hypothetical protein